MANPTIRPFAEQDRKVVIDLWKTCNLTVPWNDPDEDITLKQQVHPELFLVLETEGKIIGSAMGGYEGHRGWIYYLAVHPAYRKLGFGKMLVEAVEKKLTEMNCPKVNLMIRTTNTAVLEFYRSLGYADSEVVCLGKKLQGNVDRKCPPDLQRETE